MSLNIGDTLDGKYRIDSLIGHGSMAVVYRAISLDTGEAFAIKFVHPHLLHKSDFTTRFHREATVLESLQHPNIVRIKEFVIQSDKAYIVMELLSSETLESKLEAARINHQPLPLPDVVNWLEAICSAVDEAHDKGLVHRDLKPANILFRENGDAVLSDFGLAYLMDQPRLSESTSITGTPAYLSPEQGMGHHGDTRSDIYSLGVILFEMLTNDTPFHGNVVSVVLKHISEPPPSLRSLGFHFPPDVETVVMRALAKSPVDRFQSARVMARMFRSTIERTMPNVLPPSAVEADTKSDLPASAHTATAHPMGTGYRPSRSLGGGRGRGREFDTPRVKISARRFSFTLNQLGQSVIGLGLVLSLFFGVGWLINNQTVRPSSPPYKFVTGTQVQIVSTLTPSLSLLRGCPSNYWIGVVGVIPSGEVGKVIDRQLCGNEWWYKISLLNRTDQDWDGIGWIGESSLRTR